MITRSKMRRQLYRGGGIANLQRQGYFLGGITDILGKAGDVVKQVVKSDVGKAALLGATMYGLGGGTFRGRNFPGVTGSKFGLRNIIPNIKAMSGIGKATLATGAGALAFGGGDPTKTEGFDMARRQGNVEEYLRRYYREYMQSDWQTGWTQDEEDEFVNRYTGEYNQGGRVGLYAGGDPEDYPERTEPNIQDLIQEEGLQVGPQVKGEGIQSLDAGAPSIKRTGNMETADSDLANDYQDYLDGAEPGKEMSFEEWVKFRYQSAYYPGDVFSSDEISKLFRDPSLTTNMDRKQLHKILMNPGMFPEAEDMLIKMLRQGNAYGGRIGAFNGGVMGGRVGLKVLRDLYNDEEEEEYAQGGIARLGYRGGKLIKGQDHMLAYITPGEANTLKDLGGQETMTSEGIPAYPPWDDPGASPGTSSTGHQPSGGGGGRSAHLQAAAQQAAAQNAAKKQAAAQRTAALQASRGPIGQSTLGMSPGLAQAKGLGAQHHGSITSGGLHAGNVGVGGGQGMVPGIGAVSAGPTIAGAGIKPKHSRGMFALANEPKWRSKYAQAFKHWQANQPKSWLGNLQNIYGEENIQQAGYVPKEFKPSTKSFSTAKALHKKAITEGIGATEFGNWLTKEGSELKKAHPDYADTLLKELQISDWDKIYPSENLNVKGRNTEAKQRSALNTLFGDVKTKKEALKGTDKSWMSNPTDDFEKGMAVDEFTSDYSENKDRLDDLGITSMEEYEEFINKAISLAQGGRVGAFGGGVMGIGTPGMRLPGIPQMAPDGIEYDMRAGGFQPLGAREGKDDVKANLAKNEFVMTADAVRGAGDGNIELGAQKMYDTMKRLEGKVA